MKDSKGVSNNISFTLWLYTEICEPVVLLMKTGAKVSTITNIGYCIVYSIHFLMTYVTYIFAITLMINSKLQANNIPSW